MLEHFSNWLKQNRKIEERGRNVKLFDSWNFFLICSKLCTKTNPRAVFPEFELKLKQMVAARKTSVPIRMQTFTKGLINLEFSFVYLFRFRYCLHWLFALIRESTKNERTHERTNERTNEKKMNAEQEITYGKINEHLVTVWYIFQHHFSFIWSRPYEFPVIHVTFTQVSNLLQYIWYADFFSHCCQPKGVFVFVSFLNSEGKNSVR